MDILITEDKKNELSLAATLLEILQEESAEDFDLRFTIQLLNMLSQARQSIMETD